MSIVFELNQKIDVYTTKYISMQTDIYRQRKASSGRQVKNTLDLPGSMVLLDRLTSRKTSQTTHKKGLKEVAA